MADKRKVQLGIEVDASGTRQGFDDVKQSARDMAQSVAQSGREAGKGIEAVGAGGDQAAQKLDRASSSMVASIKRVSTATGDAAQTTKTWSQFIKEGMGPLMEQFGAEGASRAEAHARAMRQLGEEWRRYKAEVQAAAADERQSIDRASSGIVASIKRATAENERLIASMAAGSTKTATYFEALANVRGADPAALDPFLARLHELEAEVVKATAAERELAEAKAFEQQAAGAAQLNRASEYVRFWEESLRQADMAQKEFAASQAFEAQHAAAAQLVRDSEYVRMWEAELRKADAAQAELAASQAFEAQHAAAAQLVKDAEYVRFWEESLRKADAAEKQLATQNGFLDQLRGQAEAAGKTRAELFELKAAQLGVADQAAPFIAKLRAAEGQMHGAGAEAKQMAWALRLIPAQMTDIVTSLQMGQSPMTVLIQQGGQLKDMFGGIGPAARALGGYVVGLINSFTAAAAAAAVVAIAYEKGAEESEAMAKAIILSGNAAGTSVGQMQMLAQGVAEATGATRSAAADALDALVQTGKVGASSLGLAAQAAVAMERATGQAVSETVKQFEELGRSPVEASRKLDQQYHYLTASIYEQIKALEDQGKETEAADLAQKAFADTLDTRAGEIEGNLTDIEKAWRGIKDAIKGAGDAMLDIGREDTLDAQLAAAKQLLAQRGGKVDVWDRFVGLLSGNTPDPAAAVKVLQAAVDAQHKKAAAAADEAAAEDAAKEAIDAVTKANEAALTPQQKLTKELDNYRAGLEKIRATNPDSALLDPAKIAQTEAAIRKSYEQRARTTRDDFADLAAEAAGLSKSFAKDWETLRKGYADGRFGEGEQALQRLIAAQAALLKQQPAMVAQAKAEEEARKAAAKAAQELATWREKAVDAAQGQAKTATDATESLREQILTMGLGTQALAEYKAAKLDDAAAADEHAAAQLDDAAAMLETRGALPEVAAGYRELAEARRKSAAQLREQSGLTIEQAQKQASIDAAKEAQQAWQRTADTIEQSLTDALMRGFENGKGFGENLRDTLVNMFKTMVLRPIIQAIVQPVAGGAMQMMGMPAGASGGAGGNNLFGNAQQAYSLYNNASIGYQWATGSMSGANALGTVYANTTGTGLDGLLATNGAYGTAAPAAGGAGASLAGFGGAGAGAYLGYKLTGGNLGGAALGGVAGYGAATGFAATGTAAGAASGAYSALASMGPYGWIAIAILAIADAVGAFKGRSDHNGSAVLTSTDDSQLHIGHKYRLPDTYVWGGFKDADALTNPLKQLGLSVAKTVEETLAQFGDNRQVSVYSAFGADGEDPSRGNLRIYDEAGKLIAANSNEALRGKKYAKNPSDGFNEFVHDAGRVIRDALVAADLPSWADDILSSLGASPGMEGLQQAIATIQQLKTASDQLAPSLKLTEDAFVGIMQRVGGDALNAYIANYYSDAEKLQMATDQVAKQFDALGVAMPDTKEAFRAVVEGLDTSTESGRDLYASLIALSPAFAQVADASKQAADTAAQAAQQAADTAAQAKQKIAQERYGLETQLLQLQGNTAALRARELDQLDDSNRALQTYIWALQDASAAQQAAAQSAADAQAAAHQRVADAQANLRSAYDAQAGDLRQTIDQFGGIARQLREFRVGLLTGNDSPLSPAARDAEMSRQFDAVALRAQLGDTDAMQQLQSVSSQYLEVSKDTASSAEDYYRRFAKVQDVLGKSESVASRQAAIAEAQLSALDAQVGTLLSIDSGVMSVAGAIDALRAAMADAAAADKAASGSKTDTAGTGLDAYKIVVDQAFHDVLGRSAAAAGLDYWSGQLKSGAVDFSALYADIAYGAQAGDQDAARKWLLGHNYVPAFAAGGDFGGGLRLVGEQGAELEATGPSRIYSASQTRDLLAGAGNNAALLAEIRALRAEVANLRAAGEATARNTHGMNKQIQRWDGDGMPDVRAA